MIFQLEGYEFDFGLDIVMGVVILLFLMALMVVFYSRYLIAYMIIPVYIFSLIIGFGAFQIVDFPFTPYFQAFFLVFQSMMFIMSVLEIRKA